MLLSIIALTLLGLLLAVTFWPSSKPEMVETTRTEQAVRDELATENLPTYRKRELEGELSYLRYIAKLTKTQATVDTVA